MIVNFLSVFTWQEVHYRLFLTRFREILAVGGGDPRQAKRLWSNTDGSVWRKSKSELGNNDTCSSVHSASKCDWYEIIQYYVCNGWVSVRFSDHSRLDYNEIRSKALFVWKPAHHLYSPSHGESSIITISIDILRLTLIFCSLHSNVRPKILGQTSKPPSIYVHCVLPT